MKSFLKLLFELEPDENQIKSAYVEASFLGAKEGVNRLYNDLAEKGYYIQMVSGDVHQKLAISASDVVIDMSDSPFKFRASGTQQLIRASTSTTRSLVMEGYLISVKRTDRNPHGFSVENFRIAENKDLSTITRMPTELAQ